MLDACGAAIKVRRDYDGGSAGWSGFARAPCKDRQLTKSAAHPQKGGLETERTAGAAIVGMKIEPCIYQEQTGLGAYLQLGASLSSGNVGY